MKNDILKLACGRYPKEHPAMAYAFFLNDRQRADLGALAHSKGRGEVLNYKEREWNGNVRYTSQIRRAERRELVMSELLELSIAEPANTTIETRTISAVNVHLAIQFEPFQMESRRTVARKLRDIRKQRSANVALACA